MTSVPSPPPPDAGWYRDPSGPHLARFWNGDTWTDRVHDGTRERQTPPQNRATPPSGAPVALPDLPGGRTPPGVVPLIVGVVLLGLVGPAIAVHWGLPGPAGAITMVRGWLLVGAGTAVVGLAMTVYGATSLATRGTGRSASG